MSMGRGKQVGGQGCGLRQSQGGVSICLHEVIGAQELLTVKAIIRAR